MSSRPQQTESIKGINFSLSSFISLILAGRDENANGNPLSARTLKVLLSFVFPK